MRWLLSLFSERAAVETDRRAHSQALYAKYRAAISRGV